MVFWLDVINGDELHELWRTDFNVDITFGLFAIEAMGRRLLADLDGVTIDELEKPPGQTLRHVLNDDVMEAVLTATGSPLRWDAEARYRVNIEVIQWCEELISEAQSREVGFVDSYAVDEDVAEELEAEEAAAGARYRRKQDELQWRAAVGDPAVIASLAELAEWGNWDFEFDLDDSPATDRSEFGGD